MDSAPDACVAFSHLIRTVTDEAAVVIMATHDLLRVHALADRCLLMTLNNLDVASAW